MSPDIPFDIFVRFLSFVDDYKTLCAVCLLNKTLATTAQEALYHSIRLDDNNVLQIAGKLISTQRLASLVKSLSITTFRQGEVEVTPHFYQIRKLLTTLPRLSHLSLQYVAAQGLGILPKEQECPFRLQSFHCTLYYHPDIFRFLEFQSELTEIRGDWTFTEEAPFILPRTALPKLHSVFGRCSFINSVVPGRPVHTVAVTSEFRNSQSFTELDNIRRSVSPLGVQTLEIDNRIFERIEGSLVHELCPNLTHLTIRASMNAVDDSALDRLAHRVERTLETLKLSLQSFTLHMNTSLLEGLPYSYLPDHLKHLSQDDRKTRARSQLKDFAVKTIASAGSELCEYILTIDYGQTSLYARERLRGQSHWCTTKHSLN